MRIALTGATGFLGGHLLRRLLGSGHSVLAIVRDRARAEPLAAAGVDIIHGDLALALEPAGVAGVDAFVHAAALSSTWGTRAAFYAANVAGTATALALARQLGARRFIHISSPSIYFRFADQLGVGEDAPLPRPVNAYAETKALAEARVMAATDLNPLILRPRGIYGPGDRALLPRLVRAARRGPLPLLRAGTAVTDLTHVDDVVEAIVSALAASASVRSRAFNISSGEALPIVSIVQQACRREGLAPEWRRVPTAAALAAAGLAEAFSAMLPSRPEPVATRYALGVLAYSQTLDITRAAAELGWRPAIPFREGLARL